MVGDEQDTRADEWQFGIDEVGADASDVPGGSVAGGADRDQPVEPESVDLENAVFVLLGVLTTLVVFAQFVVG